MSATVICPRCGGSDCVIPAEDVLELISSTYAACQSCAPDPGISKQLSFYQLDQPFRSVDDAAMRCQNCGKRHLDIVIAHVLGILVRSGLRDRDAALSDVGTPMIAIGYPVPFPPRLGRDMLILVMDAIDRGTAEVIVNEVSEVKGVIERKGEPGQPVGILDADHTPHTYNLLAGCDVRGDIVSSSGNCASTKPNPTRISSSHVPNPARLGCSNRYTTSESWKAPLWMGAAAQARSGLSQCLQGRAK